MNKKGFTLVELLVVIVIISLITLIAVPSIIAINKNINKRLLESKKEMIVASAEVYAENNPDIFNGQTEVKVTVKELINLGFLNPDAKNNEGNCNGNPDGCLINPVDKSSLNDEYVLLRKEAVGVSAIFHGESCSDTDPNNMCATGTLVKQVCEKLNTGKFIGKYGTGSTEYCGCKVTGENVTGIFAAVINPDGSLNVSSTAVKACIISGDDADNYLRYGGVMWRVLGLYDLYDNSNKIVAKLITNDTVDNN